VDKEAKKAILHLNGSEMKGKHIAVTEVMYDPGMSTHTFRQ